MSGKTFNFKDQFALGKNGENMFSSFYSSMTVSTDKAYDFVLDGKKVELKTDTYKMEDTGNFFMEKFGSIEASKLGGPWRAASDNVDFFVYFYIQDKECFWFETQALVKFLDTYIVGKKSKVIKNRGYSTLGYAVPRSELEHLVVKQETIK